MIADRSGSAIGDSPFEATRMDVERFKYLVQRFESFLEILVAYCFADGHALAASAA